jgi:hypothetical protein
MDEKRTGFINFIMIITIFAIGIKLVTFNVIAKVQLLLLLHINYCFNGFSNHATKH